MSLSDFILGHWFPTATVGLAYSTVYTRERIADELAGMTGKKPLGKITALDFHNVILTLTKKGLASSTVKNVMKVLKRAVKDAGVWKLSPGDHRPWESVKPIKQLKAPPRVVTRDAGLWGAERAREEGDEFTADLITVLTYTGLRISEALGLSSENIDLGEGKMHIRQKTVRTNDPKNGSKFRPPSSRPPPAADSRTTAGGIRTPSTISPLPRIPEQRRQPKVFLDRHESDNEGVSRPEHNRHRPRVAPRRDNADAGEGVCR